MNPVEKKENKKNNLDKLSRRERKVINEHKEEVLKASAIISSQNHPAYLQSPIRAYTVH